MAFCQLISLNILHIRDVTNPATEPMRTYSSSWAMMSAPRFEGIRNPMAENGMVSSAMQRSCAPVLDHTAMRRGEKLGGRKTSAWTSFHPSMSSAFSLSVASQL